MSCFPFFVEIGGKEGLVIGGGEVALRKIKKLLTFGPSIRIVAPVILPEILSMNGVTAEQRAFVSSDLDHHPAFVITATDDPALNRSVASLCQKKNIPVNVADDEGACGFLFPALIQKGDLTIGITTNGASPTASRFYRQQIEAMLPDNTETILSYLRESRGTIKKKISSTRQRSRVIREVAMETLRRECPLTAAEEDMIIEKSDGMGSVALVGAGCGKADLITLRGLRMLQNCTAVVYDALIDEALLNYVPHDAVRIPMGKRAGKHSATQEEISRELVSLAKQGHRVVRLKGGDPYLFGRGGEEMIALREAGIPCCEVPGIPSPIGIPAEYGIPVTHRMVSRSLHIITSHTADTNGLPEHMEEYAKVEGTLVFLMGLSKLELIADTLIRYGKAADTPCAVLSGGNAPNPACIRGNLRTIADLVRQQGATAPAIIVVGDVTQMEL